MKSINRQQIFWGLILILPNMIGFLLFKAGPIVFSFIMNFMDWRLIKPPEFIGFDNFKRLLEDDLFLKALGNTFYYVVLFVPAVVIFSFLIANLLNRNIPGKTIFRLIFFLPSVVSFVSISILWRWLYHPTSGAINYILGLVGISGPAWLADRNWAMPAIAIMTIWQQLGYFAIIYLAGLQTIPKEYYEAAELDGAGSLAKLRYITFPLMAPTTSFVLIVSMIDAVQIFGQPYVMTKGGPGYATTSLVFLIYRNAFESFKLGYASVQAWVLFIILFAFTLVQRKLSKENG